MATVKYKHVRVAGIKTVVPETFIDIDDELKYFGGDPKKLNKAKKLFGYGRRYVVSENTTVCDLACNAAERLFVEMNVNKSEIDLLVFVNQNPDYVAPCDACVAHGMLALGKQCMTIDISLGCSGWPHALMTAHALMASGGIRKALVLAGDVPSRVNHVENRKKAQLFGDAASATLLEYDPSFEGVATFVCGTDGRGWDAIVRPFGGLRHPFTKEVLEYSIRDSMGNLWTPVQSVMKGEDVFIFTMSVVPSVIDAVLDAAGWSKEEVDFFALHQANRMIHRTIIKKAGLDEDRAPSETFTKYANNSTNSVVTVLSDQLQGRKAEKVVVCAFGVGLSWGAAALDLSKMYNGGISLYREQKPMENVSEVLSRCEKLFAGES